MTISDVSVIKRIMLNEIQSNDAFILSINNSLITDIEIHFSKKERYTNIERIALQLEYLLVISVMIGEFISEKLMHLLRELELPLL